MASARKSMEQPSPKLQRNTFAWVSFLLGMHTFLGHGNLQGIDMVGVMHLQKIIIIVPSALAVAVSKGMVLICGRENGLVAFERADARNLIK